MVLLWSGCNLSSAEAVWGVCILYHAAICQHDHAWLQDAACNCIIDEASIDEASGFCCF